MVGHANQGKCLPFSARETSVLFSMSDSHSLLRLVRSEHVITSFRPKTPLGAARFLSVVLLMLHSVSCYGQTSARIWNEALMDAIRIDFPAPTVHARNLYHTSAAMYDAWAAFDPVAKGHYYTAKHWNGDISLQEARDEAISYAAYRILSHRYDLAVDPFASQELFDDAMTTLGYDKNFTSTVGNSPAAIGNRIAQQIINQTVNDGSNEDNFYVDNTGYVPVNDPMVVDFPSVVTPDAPPLADPNRWQPLFLDSAVTQNELEGEDLQTFVGPHWGNVTTFAMGKDLPAGADSWSQIDPGPAPQLNGVGDAEYRSDTVLLIEYSNQLDPSKGLGAQTINISPNTTGNRILGTHDDRGYSSNPTTGQPYADNFVRRADYGRVLAEFWADGPDSETPPGHWNVLANEVSDDVRLEKRIGGTGDVVDDLEWDVKLYLAMNGAVHDAAIAAWGTKSDYDYVRPITKIRYQGNLGQSSDPAGVNYHPDGLPLQADLIEQITTESIAPGGRHRNVYVNANQDANGSFRLHYTEEDLVGKVAIQTWNHEPNDPESQVSGTDWILAENWVPYQQDNFVTPAFAAYVSGHSTFSRAAAEVMTRFTGDEFFPGGMGEQTFDTDFLDFEMGPSEAITLQWATYYDAADEAGISRLWGGIHVPVDDFAGRIMGSEIGIEAYEYALEYFISSELTWNNSVNSYDVNLDGFISARDALLVINDLNSRTYSDAETGALSDFDGVPVFFYDVSQDGFLTARDALLVINELNGANAISRTAFAVPEPTGVVAVAFVIGIFVVRLRRKIR